MENRDESQECGNFVYRIGSHVFLLFTKLTRLLTTRINNSQQLSKQSLYICTMLMRLYSSSLSSIPINMPTKQTVKTVVTAAPSTYNVTNDICVHPLSVPYLHHFPSANFQNKYIPNISKYLSTNAYSIF